MAEKEKSLISRPELSSLLHVPPVQISTMMEFLPSKLRPPRENLMVREITVDRRTAGIP